MLVVATYRNDELHRRHPLRPFLAEAARSERVARIDLGPLSPTEVAQLLEAIAGAALPRSVVDAVVARAEQAGATVVRPIETQFYGDRSGQFEDPFGHHWSVATHVEDVPPEEMEKRMAEAMGGS